VADHPYRRRPQARRTRDSAWPAATAILALFVALAGVFHCAVGCVCPGALLLALATVLVWLAARLDARRERDGR
jgi:hypothetical protein